MRSQLFTTSLIAVLAAPAAFAQTNLDVWHRDGQTWIRWTDNQVFANSESWSIYRASAPIVDITQATLVAKAFPQDVQAGPLQTANPGATWAPPDEITGVPTPIAANEALFVYTPRAAADEYFAVVKTGQTTVGVANTFGPVTQTIAPVKPHVQLSGVNAGRPYQVYSLWIDGDADLNAGRVDFPILASATMRGVARLFAVFEPAAGLPPAPMPMVGFLHGGDGSFWTYRPSNAGSHQISTQVDDGLYVTFDDRVWIRGGAPMPDEPFAFRTRWFGFESTYDRFELPSTTPPASPFIADTTPRQIDWILDWLVAARGVDADRIVMSGLSMGGRGTSVYVRSRPERVSASLMFVPPVKQDVQFGWDAIFGVPSTNVPTSMGLGYDDVMALATPLSTLDVPFARVISGTSDDAVEWIGVPSAYRSIDAQGWGWALSWDEREHTNNANGWIGTHFNGSPKLQPGSLTGIQRDRSFPAFTVADHDLALAGRQPDPGDDVLPANGDPWGTWGGWFRWNDASIVDTTTTWSAEIGLVAASTFANDLPPANSATCTVGVRRAQSFVLAPCTPVDWQLVSLAGGGVIASGRVFADASGHVAVPALQMTTSLRRLELQVGTLLVDCNANGYDDACDVAIGSSADANQDGIPDECQPASLAFCFGDGADAGHASACPCANTGALGNGCANSANASGANLAASGTAAANDVALHGSGMPSTSLCIYLQGDARVDTVYGDGVRCTGGSLLRLRARSNVAGASSFPDSTDTITLSARGGVAPGSGAVRYYQTYYRNAAASFCPPATFNISNGWLLAW